MKRRTAEQREWHGQSQNRSSTYRSWLMMRNRCLNKNAIDYKYYGGRGITVCETWFYFSVFLRDMGEKPPGYTIGRIDESKGYSKNNCEWQSREQQSRQRRYCKLNMKKAKQLRALRKKGYTYKQLSEKFKIGNTTVASVVRGRTWK